MIVRDFEVQGNIRCSFRKRPCLDNGTVVSEPTRISSRPLDGLP